MVCPALCIASLARPLRTRLGPEAWAADCSLATCGHSVTVDNAFHPPFQSPFPLPPHAQPLTPFPHPTPSLPIPSTLHPLPYPGYDRTVPDLLLKRAAIQTQALRSNQQSCAAGQAY